MGTNFNSFISAFGVRWFVAMSGPLGVPLTIYSILSPASSLTIFLGLTGLAGIVFAAYFIWKEEAEKVISAKKLLDAIGSQRSLYYQNANLVVRPTEIDVGLIFENLSDHMIYNELTEVFVAFGEHKVEVPKEAMAALQGYIHAKKDIRFNFTIQGMTLNPTGPAAITLGFTAKYDNIKPVKERFCERHILYEFDNLDPLQFRQSTIIRQREW